MPSLWFRWALGVGIAVALAGLAGASERPVGNAVALAQAPNLDGDVRGDPAWRGLVPFSDFKQLQPDNGEPASQRTEAYIGYTDDALYLAVVCYEDDIDKIVVSNDGFASDSATFVLDTFRSEQTALVFGTNPVGAEYDGQVAATGGFPDWNWSTVWKVRSRINDDSWSAELEIPFTSLRYPTTREAQSWGVNISRVIRRHNEIAYWSPVPKQLSMYRLDLAGVVYGFRAPKQRRNLKFMPYALGSMVRHPSADDARDEDAGFDVKYSVTPSLTLDLTYNTDFAQVESDRQQVNFGRFSLFFPETRPFFLENSGAFEAGYFEARLFHSRRIGVASDGRRLPIEGGARLSGRIGGATNIGFLHMRVGSADDSAQKTDFTVLRMSQDLPNRSSIGFIGTNRAAEDDRQTYGVDGRLGIGDYAMLSAFVAKTEEPGDPANRHAFSVFGNYDSPTWAYNAGYSEVGGGFNPAVGFVGRRNFRKFTTFGQYTVQMEGKWGLSEWKPHASYQGYWDFDGFYESGFLHMDSWFVWRSGADMWTAFDVAYEGVKEPFQVAAATVPAGKYENPQLTTGANSPAGKPFRFGIYSNIGGYYNGDRISASPFLSYRKDETFSAQFSWNFNRIDLPTADDAFNVNLVQARLEYSFTPKMSLQTLLQYNDANDVLAANVRFSWLRSASSGLYLVYNEVDDRSDFPLRSRRELVLKYSHIFDVL